ncbi:alpha/beta hydrolase [Thalassotalea sp. LPB0316]|uniref:alpha/beta fold hydrolase n=1 Tax=Thalassotalea sp. LPB0316 TaxID=2769490 RepID=UPI001865C995|nr:alpha/beta hydrolase [Thalassotalea sp. LPB0316]QOL25811.1 alpha/beta hydrolase [Thalassotalea sp. LPB0316]
MTFTHQHVHIDDVDIHFVEAGEQHQQTMVFLHGFPESWHTWQKQLDYFSTQYRVIAPDLPGYNQSDKPSNINFYQIPNLISFFAKFINAINRQREVILVAHDWGGAIAWPLVAFYPQLFSQLVILNAAHPSTFTREMINNPTQQLKSEYIHQLIAKNAVKKLSANNFEFLFNKILSSMQSNALTDDLKAQYLAVWQQDGAINGMLQYYRAMPQLAPSSQQQVANGGPVMSTKEMNIPKINIQRPTLVLWGVQDQAFVPECVDGLDAYIDELTLVKFDQASHWLHHEQSDAVNQAIENFLS